MLFCSFLPARLGILKLVKDYYHPDAQRVRYPTVTRVEQLGGISLKDAEIVPDTVPSHKMKSHQLRHSTKPILLDRYVRERALVQQERVAVTKLINLSTELQKAYRLDGKEVRSYFRWIQLFHQCLLTGGAYTSGITYVRSVAVMRCIVSHFQRRRLICIVPSVCSTSPLSSPPLIAASAFL